MALQRRWCTWRISCYVQHFVLHLVSQLGEHLRNVGVLLPGGELQLPLPLPAGLPASALPPGLLPAAFLPAGAPGAAATQPPALPPLSGAAAAGPSQPHKKGAQGPPIDVRLAALLSPPLLLVCGCGLETVASFWLIVPCSRPGRCQASLCSVWQRWDISMPFM